jgi:hypothetical protein
MHTPFTSENNDITFTSDPSQIKELSDSIVEQNITTTTSIYLPIFKQNDHQYFSHCTGVFMIDPEPVQRMWWDGIGYVSYRKSTGFEPF